ncbi:uncharacterized protein C16orf52 homolog B-like isoform X1 [Chaetodon auriga]|uniref:uncharacterized protein C16orf52 homolog B-like isoform X1 n=1 Tax=Chaetodon auriga TaxID=39042 RepID=UPI004033121A
MKGNNLGKQPEIKHDVRTSPGSKRPLHDHRGFLHAGWDVGTRDTGLGSLTVGLVRQCQTIHGRDRSCIPPQLPPEWITTLFFIILGIISLTVTCGLLVMSRWRREAARYARWIAFTGMVLFCMAALIFPIGFYINEVGGQPYKLPNNTVVGSSYVLFVLSIFFTIVGLLFAGKVCLPG